MFDLVQLRCFVAVAEELHFGRAARRLNMTQPPLSRQIKLLEYAVGAALFLRTNRWVRITPAGRSFLVEAKRLLRLAEGAALLAKSVAAGKSGSIRIGFTAGSAQSFLPHLINGCRAQLPDVDLHLKEMISTDQIEALESGQIDFGLLRPPVLRTGLESLQVVTEPLVMAIPKEHRLAKRRIASLGDLNGEPFIMYAPFESRYFYDLVAAQFANAKIFPRYVHNLSQIHSILALVRAGLGLALVPESAGVLHVDHVVLRPVRLTPARPVELHVAWRNQDDNPLVPRILSISRAVAARLRRGGR